METRRHPPLVDSGSACLCRVDSGLKSVRGGKIFVPGSNKPCVQPDHVQQSAKKSKHTPPLLPGLPDDLSIACLIRVPRAEHRKLRLVCRRWHRLLAGNYFYSLRESLGVAEEWIYVIKRDTEGRISWDALDPVAQIWQPVPPLPAEYSEALGFGCAVLGGCCLYVFGGKDPVRGSMRKVMFYSARTNKWHRAPDMLRRRHFSGSCVMNNLLYVAGGESSVVTDEGGGSIRSLRSAEVYDQARNRWSFITDMSAPMVPYIGVVHEGRWFLKGLGPHRQVHSEVYLPETESWSPVLDGMVSGWRNPCACVNGRLYALDCKDGCKLRVYNDAADSWSNHMDSGLHLGSSQALEAAALVPLCGKLCIVRNNMSMSLVDVASEGGRWETLAVAGGRGNNLKSWATNIWFTLGLGGYKHGKSHILHCQVLQV